MVITVFQKQVYHRINNGIAKIIDKKYPEKNIMVNRSCQYSLLAAGEKEYQHQRNTRKDANPNQKPAFILCPLNKFVDKNKEDENHHTELKKKTKLIITSFQTLNKNKFVQSKNSEDNAFNDRIGEMKTKSPPFNIIQSFYRKHHLP